MTESPEVMQKLGYLTRAVEELTAKLNKIERILVGNGFGGLLAKVAYLSAAVTILTVLVMSLLK